MTAPKENNNTNFVGAGFTPAHNRAAAMTAPKENNNTNFVGAGFTSAHIRAAVTGCPKTQKCHSGTLKAYPESTVLSIKYRQMVSTAESRHHTNIRCDPSLRLG